MTLNLTEDLSKLNENFCKDCRLRGMTEESIRRYRSSLIMCSTHFNNANLIEVSLQMLEKFLEHLEFERAVKQKTIENNFSALSAFYEYLTYKGITDKNLILTFRKRYLRMYKKDSEDSQRKLLTVEEMSRLVNSILDPRDKAIAVLLAKTGVRRGEMLKMDVDDIDWNSYSIMLKPTPKRSNRTIYFDDECATVLKRWLKVREKLNPATKALFISYENGERLSRNGAYQAVTKYAKRERAR